MLYTETLVAGEKLRYRVRALDGENPPSEWSEIVAPITPVDTVVQLSAQVYDSPPSIHLKWEDIAHEDGRDSQYLIYRKMRGADSWGDLLTSTDAVITNYEDNSVQLHTAYEYKIVRDFRHEVLNGQPTPDFRDNHFGYVATAIDLPLAENRGKVLLVVDQTQAPYLLSELGQFKESSRR